MVLLRQSLMQSAHNTRKDMLAMQGTSRVDAYQRGARWPATDFARYFATLAADRTPAEWRVFDFGLFVDVLPALSGAVIGLCARFVSCCEVNAT